MARGFAIRMLAVAAAGTLSVITPVASAQDEGMSEVVVTALRRDADDFRSDMPAVGLRRMADFAVIEVTVNGDTRDKEQRENEIYDMIRAAIQAAPHSGVELAYGERTLQALTLANYRSLTLFNDNRPDSQRTSFLAKVRLTEKKDVRGAQAAITAFVKSVKPVGRALMKETGDLTLSVVAPDQYRGAIADVIAIDAKAMAARLGDEYAVEIEGLNRPVEWTRSGLSEVLLYVPYKLAVVPKP